MELSRYGVWTSFRAIGVHNGPEAAKVAERLGFGTLWIGGSPRLSELGPLLAATDSLLLGTSIVNVWAYEPAQLAAEFAELEREHPGRVIVGIGIGHPEATQEYARPLATMTAFLDGIAAAPVPIPADRMVIAALGPRMLELSAARTLGTIPYFTTAVHTAAARRAVPAPGLVAPELAVVLEEDPVAARRIARDYAALYLGLRNYTANLRRHGVDDADLADGGSDALIDAVVPHGSPGALVAAIEAHLDAGADHVAIQTLGVDGVPEAAWGALAGALGLPGGAS